MGVAVTVDRPDDGERLQVSIDQRLCTGDGLCVQYAPEVFEFDVDGLAYVKDRDGQLLTTPGARTDVPAHLRLEVLDAARDCPAACIHVAPAGPAAPAAVAQSAGGEGGGDAGGDSSG
ncbi:MAG TPA: ferredoxin [Natronosporangium sp.]|nr:ferredoxin [Natronosporangium sp.]